MAPLVALAGFMGSGKSSVGGELAAELGWDFIDLDREVELDIGTPIAAFFDAVGEPAFRAREAEVLQRVLGRTVPGGLVLALGGGSLENAESREQLRRRGGLVFLEIDAEGAWGRVSVSDRPLAQDKQAFTNLWSRRQPTYEEAADWLLPARERSVEDLARDLRALVESGGAQWQGLWGRRLARTGRASLIVGGVGALSFLRNKAVQARKAGVVFHTITDRNVMREWGEHVVGLLGGVVAEEALVLEPGETSKRTAVLEQCWNWLASRKARRDDVVVALGGGVVGDLAGFAASTYHRGIGLWQVPTSLVAQVDLSLGGKTAVNLDLGKNLVGAFYQPDLVVIDPALLQTLPRVEYLSGLGEVVKHALLSSGEALALLEADLEQIRDRDQQVLSRLVKRNVWFKASVVEEDERETGRRSVLNLGHTTAHALEAVLGFGAMSHGQAVALGLLVALAASERMLGLDPGVRGRIESLLTRLGLESTVELPSTEAVLEAAGHDKKAKAGSSGFVGLRAIGDPAWGIDVPSAVFREALEAIRA